VSAFEEERPEEEGREAKTDKLMSVVARLPWASTSGERQ